MNFEQIMIRLGVDGTAVKAGLGRVTAMVKAWGASLAQGIRSYFTDAAGSIMKGFLGAEAVQGVISYLGKIKDKIIEINRISNLTGSGTNFTQSLMSIASKSGISVDSLIQGISHFNAILGKAKSGNAEAIIELKDMGVITEFTKVKTLNFTSAINNLSVSFDKLNDKQKQAYLLNQALGRGYAAFIPMFQKGSGFISSMSNSGFFTRISPQAINDYITLWQSIKKVSSGAMATVANSLDKAFRNSAGTKSWQAVGIFFGLLGKLSTGHLRQTDYVAQHELENQDRINAGKALELTADKEGISVAELKTRILDEQTQLIERQAELTSEITDRDKESVAEMASRARKLTGIKGPLEMLHTITPRMRTALRIETLEERAKVAFLRGDDGTSNRLQSEADQVRKSNPWLKRSDVNPMAKTEAQLQIVNTQLEPVKRMAELVNKES